MDTVKIYSLAAEGGVKLSTNFAVKEFKCSDNSDLILIHPKLVEVLQAIRSHFGRAVAINSAYRTVTYNAKIGGSKNSQHCRGMAADIKISGVSPAAVAAYAETLLPNTGGIGVYGTFTHIDVRAAKSRWKG